jgi:hypothetical protein
VSGARLELARLLGWKRWLVASAALIGIGRVSLNWVPIPLLRRTNQWDVVLLVLNNPTLMFFFVIPLFLALVGDVLIGDRSASFAFLSAPRAPSRGRWWMWKLEALFVAAVLYMLLVALILSVAGAWLTRLGWSFSSFSNDPSLAASVSGSRDFVLPPAGPLPVAGVLLVAAYTAVAMAAFAALILAVSLIWPRPWVPVTISLIVAVVLFFIRRTNILDPRGHVIWSHHSPEPGAATVYWWATGLWIGAAFAIALFLGRFLLNETDL